MYLQIVGYIFENFFILMEKIMWTWHRAENKFGDFGGFSALAELVFLFFTFGNILGGL